MSGWSFETGGGNSKKQEFTKFPEGITKIRIIDVEPVERWTHWMARDKRSINCPGKGCPICEIRKQEKANKLPYTYPMARRFALQVLNRNTNKLKVLAGYGDCICIAYNEKNPIYEIIDTKTLEYLKGIFLNKRYHKMENIK